MRDSRGARHISVTIKSAPLAVGNSSEEAVISDRENRFNRMMLDCLQFSRAISETPHMFACFFFVCIQRVGKSLDMHLFNLQILFLPLLPLVLRELPVLLHEEDVCVTLPNHSLDRLAERNNLKR